MTHSENTYREDVFLEDLRSCKDRADQQVWAEHQRMQIDFLERHGLQSSSTVLDLGCGPMRLGSVLIPRLTNGWYFGQDLNPETIVFGEEVLREVGIETSAPYTLFASDQFELAPVDRDVDIVFSNSLFSHLTLNSILVCLKRLESVLAPGGVIYSTFFAVDPGCSWLEAQPRCKWGNHFQTFPHQDPYHYESSVLAGLVTPLGFKMDLMPDYGHPTQTMARFRRRRRLMWFR